MNPATCALLPTSTPTYNISWASIGMDIESERGEVLRSISMPAFLTSSLPGASFTASSRVGGEAGPRGRASTNFGPEVGFNLVSGVRARPPSFFSRVKLQSIRRVLRGLFQLGATQLGFSTDNST